MRRFFVALLCLLMAGPLVVGLQTRAADQIGDGTWRRIRVPILMYHYISPLPEDADDIRTDLTITPDLFREHMAYLAAEGYDTITLDHLEAALLWGHPLPDNPVILTFDDGYTDHYEYVLPVLQDYGFTGTFFVITGRADRADAGYLTWAQIKMMADGGMNMQPHTKNHVDLRERDREFLVYEMLGSRESVEAHTGHAARMFSYPAGRYDAMTLDVAEALDLALAVTTRPGMLHTTDARLELPRVRVHGDTTAAGLAYLLSGAWIDQ